MSNASGARFDFNREAFDALPPDKRRMAIRAMAEMVGGHRSNPLFRFDPLDPNGTGIPHRKQHAFLASWKDPDGRLVKRRVMVGGNRSGKTDSGDVADIIDCCDMDAVPPHLQPYKRWEAPVKMFLVAVDNRAVDLIHLPKFRQWCPKDQLVGNSVEKALNKEFNRLHFKNGSWIQFMTQKMDVEAFQGADLHRVHFDEEPLFDHGQAIYAECMQRLVDHNGDVLITFTPLNGMTWSYDDIVKPWEEQQPTGDKAEVGFGDVQGAPLFLTKVSQDDNPTLDDEGKATALAVAKTDEERQARKSGKFVSFAGRIFDDFNTARHVVPDEEVLERFRASSLQQFLGAIDPGFRHMAGVLWLGLDHDGVWVFPELALEKTVISDVAREILLAQQTFQLRPTIFIADPAIAKTDSQTGKTDQQAYAEAGILTRPGNNQVRPGINAIRGLLQRDRLHIGAGCPVLIDQMNRYRWLAPKRSEDAAPQRPVKRDDHLVDPLRYGIMSLPIPEAAPAPDERSKLERLLAGDIRAARTDRDLVEGPLGAGYWD